MNLVSTGISALDQFLRGGLPPGFCTLLLAPSGSGSETFAKQFASSPTEHVVYISTDESSEEIRQAMNDAGWRHEHVEVMDLQSEFADAMMASQDADLRQSPSRFMFEDEAAPKRRFDPRALIEGAGSQDIRAKPKRPKEKAEDTDYLRRLFDPFTKSKTPDRVVVHSLDFFLNLYPLEQVVATITALKAANARRGGQLLLVLAKGAHGNNVERRLELLADCLIELEMQRNGTKFDRFLMVKKVKNKTHGIGVSTYEVGPHGFTMETLERIV